MKRQRNTTQMKEKTRNTGAQTNEEEIGKLPEKESSPRGTKSLIQDKPKEKHTKTHTNQTNKD